MKVKVKLFATLRHHLPPDAENSACDVELSEGTRVNSVMENFKLPPEIPKIILINGIQKDAETELTDGDTLSIFPPIAGG